MRMALIVVATLGSALVMGGCASVGRGLNTPWEVHSAPAGAQVVTSHGRGCPATPCVIQVPRRSDFTATLLKDGYEPTTIPVYNYATRTGLAATALNLAFFGLVGLSGGLVGAGVDTASGAGMEVTPNPANVTLPLRDPSQPPPR